MKHETDQAEAMKFAKVWALKNSAGKIANLARAYLAVCRDVLKGVQPTLLRWVSDNSGESQVEACLFAVCGCGVVHVGLSAAFLVCPHCKKRGVKCGDRPGYFPVMMLVRPLETNRTKAFG